MADVDKVIDSFSGMITREQAARLAGDGVGEPSSVTDRKRETLSGIDVAGLIDFMNHSVQKDPVAVESLQAYVYRIFNPVSYAKAGKAGIRRTIVVGAEGNTVKANLFDRAAEFIDTNAFERGDMVLLKDLILNPITGELGSVQSTLISRVKPSAGVVTDFMSLKEGARNIDVVGRLMEIGPIRHVGRIDRAGQIAVADCTVTDSKYSLPVSLWGSSALATAGMSVNSTVKIEFCSVRSKNGRMELYANDLSRVFSSPLLDWRLRK
ncbi:MAG: hypothetical protein KGH98_00945 [Candidatus Micrarchaeota archaeon]|nr:hypothetical protein [Candidatus Micrarchaeota archaeon]